MKDHSLALLLIIIGVCFYSCHKGESVKPQQPDTGHYYADGDVRKLYYNSPTAVNIVVLGDGFTKSDLKVGGNYDTQVKTLIDYLFTVAPFSQNKQNFNTYQVYALSTLSGSTIGTTAPGPGTSFGSYFDPQIPRLLIPGNYGTVYQYVQYALPLAQANLIILIVNSTTYGGSGGAVATVSVESTSRYIMVHEIGHTFGHLGDEYVDTPDSASYPLSEVPFFPNVDNTGDPAKIKWAHFLTQPAYKGVVGAYEGAYFRPYGLYRPEDRSIMTDLSTLNYNAPSREAIARQIDTIMNVPFNFQAFLTADAGSIQPIYSLLDPNIHLPLHDFLAPNERARILQVRKTAKYYPQHTPVN